jgi:ABC-type amino acid transport substrate-binding protein
MKKKILFLSTLILLTQQLSAQKISAGDSWGKVKSSGGALSVVYYEQAGLIQDSDGKPTGLCVDVLEDFVAFIQTKYGKKITINYLGKEPVFANFLAAAQNNVNVLGVTNVTVTEERKKFLKFTPPFMSNSVVMVTHKDAPNITDLSQIKKSFAGYSAEIIGGSTHIKHATKIKNDYWPDLSISSGISGPEIFKKMSVNPKLFTILDFTEFVDANRKKLPLKKQAIEFGKPEELAFVMAKQSDWDAVWKEFLTEEYRKSAKYRKNIADNLGSAFLSVLK